ncbi:MAG: translocation/assembly module TamB domain-containing protein [Chakrabartia sp.]
MPGWLRHQARLGQRRHRLLALFGALLLVLGGLMIAADTGPGHRFLVARLVALTPKNGLRIDLHEIRGSIYGEAELVGLRLRDPQGVFFEAPRVALSWNPFAWLGNRLDIRRLHAARATLHRLPRLRPGRPDAPLLPDYDIHIGQLGIDQLALGRGLGGPEQMARLAGQIDTRDNEAQLTLRATAARGDRLALHLVALPEADRFDLDLALDAPANGTLGGLMSLRAPFQIRAAGDGSWTRWQGRLDARLDAQSAAHFALTAREGVYGLTGTIEAGALPAGRVRQLAAPRIDVQGSARLANRRLAGKLRLRAPALDLAAEGGLNLATSSFDGLVLNGHLQRPQALMPRLAGQPVGLKLALNGPFRQPEFEYLLSAPLLRVGTTGLEGVRASGRGVLGSQPARIPVRLEARRVTGIGDVAGGMLAHFSLNGTLLARRTSLMGDGLNFRSDKLNGKLSIFVDLRTGRYDLGLDGQISRYLIPGIGLVDVRSTLSVVPGADGRGTRILGRGEAWVRRFDNRFFATLTGGLPRLETGLERTPDGVLHFTNMRLNSPHLTLTLAGTRQRDGRFLLSGKGQHTSYGPLELALEGPIARPKINLLLARPNAALGLANVRLLLVPKPTGYDWTAMGGSAAGPLSGRGDVLLPQGRAAQIRIAQLRAGTLGASGQLTAVPGGLAGAVLLEGAAKGRLDLDVAQGRQRIRADVDARRIVWAGSPQLAFGRGRFNGTLLLGPKGPDVDGRLSARDVAYGSLTAARLDGTLRMAEGQGSLSATLSGARGRDFTLTTQVRFTPDRLVVTGDGAIDGKPIQLDAPAVLLREARGWRLAPTALRYAGGTAELSGLLGGARPEMTAVLSSLPLDLLDVLAPRLGLGGRATGTLFYAEDTTGEPAGRIDLKVRGLTRAGVALASRPVDLALVASFGNGEAGARMVAALGGQTIGRGQLRLSGLGGEGTLGQRFARANLFGQLRYNGDAGTLWRLTGIETFDLSGNVAIAADISGRPTDPAIRGSVRSVAARIESPVSGMVLTNVAATGRFDGARLVLDGFSADAGRGGRITGEGTINFAETGRGLDLSLQAENAQLIARDDLGATVTGPLRIRSDGRTGQISGTVRVTRSKYVLGQSAAAAAIPRLKVQEVNAGLDARTDQAPALPWTLDIKADIPGRLMVSGLGLDSEWRARLDVQGSLLSPAITGTAELVRGGYEFAGRRFDLQRGVIRFRGESPPDPTLDIVAAGDTEGLAATIRVAGTGQRPEISFASVPALPQEELLSRLLFGTSITNLSAPEAVQLAAAIASMRGGGGLNPINALRKAVGLDRLRILPADTATGQRTSVAAGKYLTRRAFVEVITDGQGYSATRAEFQVTRWLSILSTISTLGDQSAAIRVSKDY